MIRNLPDDFSNIPDPVNDLSVPGRLLSLAEFIPEPVVVLGRLLVVLVSFEHFLGEELVFEVTGREEVALGLGELLFLLLQDVLQLLQAETDDPQFGLRVLVAF